MIHLHRLLTAPLLLACAPLCAAVLPATPEAAAERMVALNNTAALRSAEGKALLAGELKGFASAGSGILPAPDKVFRTGPLSAVARVPALAGANPDLYLFLDGGRSGWRLTAIRSLALTGVLEELIRMDDAAPSNDPEERDAIRNAKLTLSSDRELLAWAQEHRALLAQARAEPRSAELERALKAAGASRVREEDGLLIISVGGIIDNEVGFLLPTSGRVPAISPSTYIWIEPAADGWYLFKTT